MSDLDDIKAELATVQADATAMAGRVAAAQQALQDQITALQAAAGTIPGAADIIAGLQAVDATLNATDPPPAPPAA